MKPYTEAPLTVLVLDYMRQASALRCLQSLRDHILVPHRIVYLHNGLADYPISFLRDGLIDDLIMPRENGGLGLGTRALFAASFSELSLYWQCDQIMGRDLGEEEVQDWKALLTWPTHDGLIMSIGLAGPVCGRNVYSERAHVIRTADYRSMEHFLPLSHGGAGPYHDVPWREGQIQEHYRKMGYIHLTDWSPLAIDNGKDAIRQNPDGSVWRHEPDTKRLWLISGPVKDVFVYPKLTGSEWHEVITTQSWPPGKVPEQEVKDSFSVAHWH